MNNTILILILSFVTTLISSNSLCANSWLYASLLQEKKIVCFQRNDETGELARTGETDCPAEPACMAVSPNRKTLFVSLRSTGQLAAFHIDSGSGNLSLINVVDGGEDPAYLLPDKRGQFLLSAYYVANKVCVHSISENGAISENPRQTIPTARNAHGIVLDEKNLIAFVPHTGANRIYQFNYNYKVGQLSPAKPPYALAGEGEHPRHIALHPTAKWAYTSNEAGDSLGVYAVSTRNALLRPIQTVSTLPEDFDGARNSTARLEMTPDGRFVYVANRGHDSIACFSIDRESGLATSLGQVPTEATPRSFTIAPNGKHLFAAGQASGRIAAYNIGEDGHLTRFATYDSGPVSWWVLAIDTPSE